MLIEDKPRRTVSQAPLKETTCYGGCGTSVQYRTSPRVCCPECGTRNRVESARRAAEARRRKAGVPKVKGQRIRCRRCAAEVVLNRNAATKYCRPCSLIENGIDARRRSRLKASTPQGRAALSQWQRNKRASDPAWRVSAHMKVLMHRGLNGRKAGRSWKSFVPYTLEDLMAHLERQFLQGMTWENKGKWHIDHVTPLSSFEFTSPNDPDFQAAWALPNLRPLWGSDNIRKNAKRTHLL